MPIPQDRLREVVLEALRRDFGGRWLGLTQAVAWVAIDRGMTPPRQDTRIIQIEPADEPALRALVAQLAEEGVLEVGAEEPGAAGAIGARVSLTPAGRALVFGERRGDTGSQAPRTAG